MTFNIRDFQVLQDMEERYYTLSIIPGGMGEVRIALDRHLAPVTLMSVSQILEKCHGLNPDNLKAEGPFTLSDKDRLKITINIVLGLINTALNFRNDGMVAIKLIRPDLSTERAIDTFRYEARVWLEIARHRNIVKLKEIVRLPNQLALILEYVDSGTLRDLISIEKPLGLSRTLEIAMDICDGMDYLHSTLGILHRDLKPENVLMSLDGTAMITDFGLAKAKQSPGFVGSPAHGGTPEYMPPEQEKNPSTVDERADIFPFGVVLYEMATGKRPCKGRIDHDKLTKVPRQLQDIVVQCLSLDYQKRPSSFRVIKGYLNEIVKDMNLVFPLSPNPELPWEHALLVWCNRVMKNVESYPPQEILSKLSSRGGPVINHCVLGSSRKDEDKSLDVERKWTAPLAKVYQWVKNFKTDTSSYVDWDAMVNAHEEIERKVGGPLTSEGISFYDWYRKGTGLLTIGCFKEAVRCFERVLIGTSDDGVQWDPRGRTEYGLACLGIGLALLEIGLRTEAENALDEAMRASFYPVGVRDSYLGSGVTINVKDERKDVSEIGVRGSEIEMIRRARALCANAPRTY